ncbi:MAG TPA: cyclase family protein [Gemmatimonadaceae bacterium]
MIDISITLASGTPEWPGDTPFSCGWTAQIASGESVNVSMINTSPHVGTHADAPLHVRDGAAGSDRLPLDAFLGPVVVVNLARHEGVIDRQALRDAGLTATPARLLLRTDRTIARGAFPDGWPAISAGCAAELAGDGLLLLGVDCPSVDERASKVLAVHHALFDGGAYVLENLDLSQVPSGHYDLIALPVKLAGLDAAPVRAILQHP